MSQAAVATLISALIQSLDLIDRLATKQFDNRADLDAYIEQRNAIRENLVALATESAVDPPDDNESEPAGDDPAHGVVTRALNRDPEPDWAGADSPSFPPKRAE